ncbi:hypothetical protein M0R72_20720 [Candidatus Pacearchaeota archaeon]|jgi:hypothetical protein|nr:hypothetical protein [Candidatus Pacearchaeota archaeon]
MNENDSAYLEGIQDGYALGFLAVSGQSNPAYEAAYNEGVAILNSWMDSVGYQGQRWGELQHVSPYELPAVFDLSIPIEGLKK